METLGPLALADTELVVTNMIGAPENIDYYWPKHIIESAVFNEVMRLEQEGFDAVIVGCCYDPGVRVARELVDIPVVGPLEAALNMSSYMAHRPTIVTDHHKAVPWIEDLVRLYGQQNVRGVRSIGWWVPQMVRSPPTSPATPRPPASRRLPRTTPTLVILGCTIIAACVTQTSQATGQYRDVPIVNPNLLALKSAEALADLWQRGEFHVSRRNFYEKQAAHDAAEFEDVKRRYASSPSAATAGSD